METFMADKAPKGYDLFNYYGVMMMRIKKNGKYQIRLQYDFLTHAVNSKPIEFKDFKTAIAAYELLDKFSKFKKEDDKQEAMEELLLT